MTAEAGIGFRTEGAVASIELNRPEKHNALAGPMRPALLAALERAQAAGVQIVTISGAGRAFCAGGDVQAMAESKRSGLGPEAILEPMRLGAQIVRTIATMDALVIALMHGAAAGAGAALACACDLRWAQQDTRFFFSWGKLGLHPDWGASYNLPRLVGEALALDWMSTGDAVDADTALRSGLIDRKTAERQLTSSWLEQILRGSPASRKLLKRSLRNPAALEHALSQELEAQRACWEHPDSTEGILAFVEKRPARFLSPPKEAP